MKQGNLEKWTDCKSCENLLLFSELVNELLFDYSIPSNRVATLNSHFLCLDAMSAITGIDNNGVPEGTLKPIAEELFNALKVDPVFADSETTPLNYFVKNDKRGFRIVDNISELNYLELKNAITSIHTLFFCEYKYFDNLKQRIKTIIITNDTQKQLLLFRLVKSLLTEIINIGYSSQYIYYVMDSCYWNPQTSINKPNQIDLVFDNFSLKNKDFKVVFIVDKSKIYKYMHFSHNVELHDSLAIKTGMHKESQFINIKKKKSFITVDTKALDFYSAAENARALLSLDISIYRLYNHEYRYNINTVKCGVYEEDTFYRVSSPKSAVSHKKMPSNKKIQESIEISQKALEVACKKSYYDLPLTLIKAIEFHSHSLDSISKENQLLDFWAIFESVLDISNEHTSDRIQQVCLHLVPILKRRYIYSLFEQLASDIKTYSEEDYCTIIGNASNNNEIVQKTCEFVLLKDNHDQKERFLSKCDCYPLLKERINYYADKMKSPKDVYQFVEKHADRVKWQIMRIYRNRNLIIHNGESMPYLNLLIENLHSYVDEFIEYIFISVSKGNTIESMCQDLFIKECQWNAQFSRNKNELNADIITAMLSY